MASAEAGRFASFSEEDFEFNLVDQFFKLVRIVVKTCLLLIFFLFLILLLRTSICVFLIAIFSQISYIAFGFGIIKHLFTGYSDNSKFIVPLDTNYFPAFHVRK